MSTLLRSECIQCLAEKQMRELPEDAKEEQKLVFLQRMFETLAKASPEICAPVLVRDIAKVYTEVFGETQDYSGEKSYFNQLMLTKEQAIREQIHSAEDPLLKAMQYSMVGNYIDFSAMRQVEETHLEELLKNVEQNFILGEQYESLKRDLGSKKNLLFLTDNAGEAVLDKLLLEVIWETYPQLQVKVLVKGYPVSNDVTMEDALEIGLQDVAEIYDNGNGIAGTWLPELSPRAKAIWDEAEVILSKGQANYETLRLCSRNIYFLFLCKCKMFCESFHVSPYTGVLVHKDVEKF
ncbi:MAG: ARMT1-like domain-containing protein [Clostridiales bacterium]|nr:ARMT1-like domain-containing protein [Clostridiales bacterium]